MQEARYHCAGEAWALPRMDASAEPAQAVEIPPIMEGVAMLAREIMTKNPACATTNASAQQVAKLMEQNDCGCVPVLDAEDNRKLVGVVTDRDLALRAIAKGMSPNTPISQLMTQDVTCVS